MSNHTDSNHTPMSTRNVWRRLTDCTFDQLGWCLARACDGLGDAGDNSRAAALWGNRHDAVMAEMDRRGVRAVRNGRFGPDRFTVYYPDGAAEGSR